MHPAPSLRSDYHRQLPSVASLAQAFPETTIVVNHLGSPLGAGPYAGRADEIFPQWQRNLSEVAAYANCVIKLGGLAMPWNGFGWEARDRPPSSDEFVATYRKVQSGEIKFAAFSTLMEEFDSLVGGMDDEAKPEDVKVDEAEEEDTTA